MEIRDVIESSKFNLRLKKMSVWSMWSLGVPFISVRDGRYHGIGRMGPPGPPGKTGPKGITKSVACNN